jgi:hypothetical protein
MHLRGEAQASQRIVGRRFVPPAISTQDCRQDVSDPRLWNAKLFPALFRGVAHVLPAVWQPPTLPSVKIA